MKNQLNLCCPINVSTGYGITSINTTISMSKLVDVSLFNVGGQMGVDNPDHKDVLIPLLNNSLVYDKKSPCLKIWHQHDLATRIGIGDYYVMPFFEADKLYDREIYQINQADGIFTPTKWGKEVLENNGIKIPIYVCPLGVDLKIFTPNIISTENTDFTFLHVGKWETRKSQEFLLKAFELAFNPEDKVKLWLLPYNPFLTEEENKKWLDLIDENKLASKITAYGRLPTHYDVAKIMKSADCGVFLSRAEGWNNEIPEMMAVDKPIIATNYSAHTEYCTKDNSFLVDIDETEPANDGKWFHGNGNWAKLGEKQLEQTIEHMRFVYNNNVRTNPSGVETAKLYSWDNTASVIHQTLLENNSYNANT